MTFRSNNRWMTEKLADFIDWSALPNKVVAKRAAQIMETNIFKSKPDSISSPCELYVVSGIIPYGGLRNNVFRLPA